MAIKGSKEGKDELEKMGIGLVHKVEEWLRVQNIHASKVESEIVDGKKVFYIDVEGDVWLDKFNLDDVANIPNYIKFRNVTGKFILGNSK